MIEYLITYLQYGVRQFIKFHADDRQHAIEQFQDFMKESTTSYKLISCKIK